MPVDVFITFSTAMLILALTPGPGVFASVSQALSSGFRSAFPLIGGLILGDLCFLTLAVFGLSAVAHVLWDLFFLIKLAGGAYLIWLGWRMWTRAPGSFDEARSGAGRTGGQRFLGGLLITLSNPKVILFYAGFLPTFVDLAALKARDVLVIGALVAVILSVVLAAYAFSASRARRLFRSPRALRNLNRSAGSIMIGAGIVIATR